MPRGVDKRFGLLQQQSLGKAAEEAAAEVIHDAQDYVAAESAAMRNKQAKDKSVDQLTAQGELFSILGILPCKSCACLLPGTLNHGAQFCGSGP